MAYKSLAAGYLVVNEKVLLVHHDKMDKWTPPGGHMEPDETPDQTVVREFKEETKLDVEVIPVTPPVFAGNKNAIVIPLPFHMDLEAVDEFDVPHIGHFYFVKLLDPTQQIEHQEAELRGVGWFSKDELKELQTFEQVRALANYALDHYPN